MKYNRFLEIKLSQFKILEHIQMIYLLIKFNFLLLI
jgi:hypothetical protein